MPQLTDFEHAVEHYRTQDHLQVRIQTHQLYSDPEFEIDLSFPEWVLSHYDWSGDETVIDLGCGNGMYQALARQRAQRYIASDLSHGMLSVLPDGVAERVNLNIVDLPFPDNVADVLLANHMLYHVENKAQALREIRRILKPGGTLIAATNGEDSMINFHNVISDCLDQLQVPADQRVGRMSIDFTLENGADVLHQQFKHVERFDFHGALLFPKAAPAVAYLMSSWDWHGSKIANPPSFEEVALLYTKLIEARIATEGRFHVPKLTGVFVCRNG